MSHHELSTFAVRKTRLIKGGGGKLLGRVKNWNRFEDWGERIQLNRLLEKIFFWAAEGKLFSFPHYPPALIQSRNILLLKCTFCFQVLYKCFIPIMNTVKGKKDPCTFYRSTVREPLFLPLFLAVGGKCRETSKRILSLEILKEIFSSLCKTTANMAYIWKKRLKEEKAKMWWR